MGAMVLIVLAVTPANAVSITGVNPSSGLSASSTSSVNVDLSFSAGEAFYAIAQCNTDLADGQACKTDTAIGLVAVGAYPSGGEDLTVNKTFTNGSLIPGVPPAGTSTSCKGSTGANCVIAVSTYGATGSHLDTREFAISFN